MGFLKAARDGLSGDTKHWSRTHNAVLGELIEKVKALPSERVDFFTRLLLSVTSQSSVWYFLKTGSPFLRSA